MKFIIELLNSLLSSVSKTAYAMEPYIGRVNMSEEHYTAMQGIIHLIGWSLAIGILIWVFRYMKKHAQKDERYQKYMEKHKQTAEEKKEV